jgi:hypothetical protein
MKRKLEGLMRGRLLESTEGIQEMDKKIAMKILLDKAEEIVDMDGVFKENEQEDSEEEEGQSEYKTHPFGKFLVEAYEQDEMEIDIELYGIDWDMAHKEAFGEMDLEMLNTNVQAVDADKIMIEKDDLDDMLKE